MPYLAPIVEGHGEVEAVPVLLQRIAQFLGVSERLTVNMPIRVKSGEFLNRPEAFGRAVTMAAAKARHARGAVLIMMDCDLRGEEGCAARLGPRLLAEAQALHGDVPMIVSLAEREFESWFLAAAASLSGVEGLPDPFVPPANHGTKRDAKGILNSLMDGRYDPIAQRRLAQRMSLQEAAAGNRSFRRLAERLGQLWTPP